MKIGKIGKNYLDKILNAAINPNLDSTFETDKQALTDPRVDEQETKTPKNELLLG